MSTDSVMQALNEIEHIFINGLTKFKDACACHIPCGVSCSEKGYIKYIPEQCFLTYISWALINSGFAVFNEQEVDGAFPKRARHFDLIARRFSRGCDPLMQLKIEAKGDLENGFGQILADINRMETCAVPAHDFKSKGLCIINSPDNDFPYRFNCVVTQNWGWPELARWWIDDSTIHPEGRYAKGWSKLKAKLRLAQKREKFTVFKSCNGWQFEVLYAIFADSAQGTGELPLSAEPLAHAAR